jgi:CO/xanthine dehydrogenase Mo-binding subunit
MGNAVRMAAAKVKTQLFAAVASKLEVSSDDLVVRDGRIFVRGFEERGMTIPQAFLAKFGSLGTTITGEAICQTSAIPMDPKTGLSEKCTEYWFPSATAAEVEVEPETGKVRVLRLYSVGDTGTAINPKHCEQQLIGGAIAHLGQTLFEYLILENGRIVNGTLLDYQIASIRDFPETVKAIVVEVPIESGPFGAKGVGETGSLTVSAAIANAVEDALGVRIKELPITPEKILRALALDPPR